MPARTANFPHAAVGQPPLFAHGAAEAPQHSRFRSVELPTSGGHTFRGQNHLAINIELTLPISGITDANWARTAKPGEMGQLRLIEGLPAIDVVGHLQFWPGQACRVQQPIQKVPCIVIITDSKKSLHSETGVPKPTITVVPIAIAADPFQQ